MSSVVVDVREGVALITLNAPERRNALDLGMVGQLEAAFDRIDADETVSAVVMTGAGADFCAGADVNLLLSGDIATFRRVYEAFLRVLRCPLPTVAAVNGAAAGAGFNMALACDICLTVPRSRLISRFLDVGLHPGGGHTWLLDRIVGPARAKAVVLFGEELNGETAVEAGLALRCMAPEQLLDEAHRLARRAAGVPRELLVRTKQTMGRTASVPEHAAALEIEAEAQAWSTRLPYLAKRLGKRSASG